MPLLTLPVAFTSENHRAAGKGLAHNQLIKRTVTITFGVVSVCAASFDEQILCLILIDVCLGLGLVSLDSV
jgi:hypothetical protein